MAMPSINSVLCGNGSKGSNTIITINSIPDGVATSANIIGSLISPLLITEILKIKINNGEWVAVSPNGTNFNYSAHGFIAGQLNYVYMKISNPLDGPIVHQTYNCKISSFNGKLLVTRSNNNQTLTMDWTGITNDDGPVSFNSPTWTGTYNNNNIVTGNSYTLTTCDSGGHIIANIIVHDNFGNSQTFISDPVIIPTRELINTCVNLTVSDPALSPGTILTATPIITDCNFVLDSSSITYSWNACSGSPINEKTYTIVGSDLTLDKNITVECSFKDTLGNYKNNVISNMVSITPHADLTDPNLKICGSTQTINGIVTAKVFPPLGRTTTFNQLYSIVNSFGGAVGKCDAQSYPCNYWLYSNTAQFYYWLNGVLTLIGPGVLINLYDQMYGSFKNLVYSCPIPSGAAILPALPVTGCLVLIKNVNNQQTFSDMFVNTRFITPHQYYLGTEDDFRGPVNGGSIFKAATSICAHANMMFTQFHPNLPNPYPANMTVFGTSAIAGTNYFEHQSPDSYIDGRTNGNWEIIPPGYGEGWGYNGVEWVRCSCSGVSDQNPQPLVLPSGYPGNYTPPVYDPGTGGQD